MTRAERIRAFVDVIWRWYAVHKRSLPWRDLPDTDPMFRAYKILVSEVMLQQTQVPRVIVKYREFLERFPTIGDLAGATNRDVLLAWRGMGYNSRALRLRDAAKVVVHRYSLFVTRSKNEKRKTNNELQDFFPCSMEELTSVSGIGHYTAAAIRNFAFGIPTPCVDTNIRRILHRTFVGPENPDGTWEKDDDFLLNVAAEVLREAEAQSKRRNRSKRGKQGSSFTLFSSVSSFASEWHAALMDYGSLIQTKRNPKWDLCPLTRRGIMRTTKKNYGLRITDYGKFHNPKFAIRNPQSVIRNHRKEPGRTVGSTFIPNRIFRGRIVEALRDAPRGLTLHDIGKQIALDWDPQEHRQWLSMILSQLTREAMLGVRGGKYVLG